LCFDWFFPDAIYSLTDSLLYSFSNGGGEGSITEQGAATILRILKQTLALPSWVKSKNDPFETLTVTIISQNTADRNTAKAFEQLSQQLEISPEALAKAELSQIEDAIKPAGLYRSKAKAIKQAATTILQKYRGTMQPILSLPLEEARKNLMQFPGVGPKTADVVLLFSAKQPTVPVDTHVDRVSKRLGFAPMAGDYEAVRKSLQTLFNPSVYLEVHVLLIAHGRKTCTARHPLCNVCPVNTYCPTCGQWG
jgi:endonuclease-3